MENIYLVSTNNVFINKVYSNISTSFPSLRKKEEKIIKIQDKKQLIELIKDNVFDFIIMDTSLISIKEIINELSDTQSGLVWIIDSNSETKRVNDHLHIWNSHADYKNDLYRLGTTNTEIKKSGIKSSHLPGTKDNPIQEINKDKTNDGSNIINKPQETSVEKSNNLPESVSTSNDKHGKNTFLNTKNEGSILDTEQQQVEAEDIKLEDGGEDSEKTEVTDDEPTVISIAPPYPQKIEHEIHSRLLEARTVDLSLYPSNTDSKEERIIQLEPYVKEYFSLVGQKEFLSGTDKRLAATLEMFEYINMNRSIKNKSVGVWSPVSAIGVTTFVMNFAFHLGERRLPISVMEGLKETPMMFKELERIAPTNKIFPKDWLSYVSYMNKRKELDKGNAHFVRSAVIDYKGVYWFPLAKTLNEDYNASIIEDIPYYLSFGNPREIVLVDLPNGEFKKDSRKLIKELKELWILLDGSTDIIFSYINYIEQLQADNPHLRISLILLDYFPYVSKTLVEQSFKYPVLATLPDLHSEIRKNKYEHMSIMENEDIKELLQPSFSKIGRYLYEEGYIYQRSNKKSKLNTYYSKSLDKLKGFFV
ncbi:hypothetical protein [Oceanobacillus luteolus]|uniref:Uncharacterized protein n=1 Tax=Oceanobacillus luteolus TaxID=1274358 RepID=A0ABW4HVV4_9BACI